VILHDLLLVGEEALRDRKEAAPRLETNIRVSTVLGMVGAGGIELISSMKLFQYENTATCVLVVLVLVLAADLVSSKLRALVR
jgi:phosphonate transport system permease protein